MKRGTKGYDLLTSTNQAAVGMDCFRMNQCSSRATDWKHTVNWLGSPLESKKTSMEGSQVPRSMKYLEDTKSAGGRRWLGAPFTGEC